MYLNENDEAYIKQLSLSQQAIARVLDFVAHDLGNANDDIRTDPANRLDPNKPFYRCDFSLVDCWGDERFHRIEFVIDDSEAFQGRLAVVFVQHTDSEWNWPSD